MGKHFGRYGLTVKDRLDSLSDFVHSLIYPVSGVEFRDAYNPQPAGAAAGYLQD